MKCSFKGATTILYVKRLAFVTNYQFHMGICGIISQTTAHSQKPKKHSLHNSTFLQLYLQKWIILDAMSLKIFNNTNPLLKITLLIIIPVNIYKHHVWQYGRITEIRINGVNFIIRLVIFPKIRCGIMCSYVCAWYSVYVIYII